MDEHGTPYLSEMSEEEHLLSLSPLNDIKLILKHADFLIQKPILNSQTPYSEGLKILSRFGVSQPDKVLSCIPKDVLILNPEVEDELEVKKFALDVYLELKELSFQCFDSVFSITNTDPQILCDIYLKVLESNTHKVNVVNQYLKAWFYVGVDNRDVTLHILTSIFFKYDFGPSSIRRCGSISAELYLDFLKKLDSFLKDPNIIVDNFKNFKLNRQVVQKKCRSAIGSYYNNKQVLQNVTPNFYMGSYMNKVHYYAHLKHKGEISEPAFLEMLRLIAAENTDVYNEILKRLKNPNENYKFRHPPLIPPNPVYFSLTLGSRNGKYYTGKFNRTLIIENVFDYLTLDNMLAYFSNTQYKVIGFDAEWLPVQECQTTEVALFQVSNSEVCFLIDTLRLSQNVEGVQKLLETFFSQVLSHSGFTKLGYSYNEDFRRLAQLLKIPFVCQSEVLDLNKIHVALKHFMTISDLCPSRELSLLQERCDTVKKRKYLTGLSSFVYLLFGRELDKREQISNWEQRPLRREQQIYAAMDAYCLVDIYHRLNHLSYNVFGYPSFPAFIDALKDLPVPKQTNNQPPCE